MYGTPSILNNEFLQKFWKGDSMGSVSVRASQYYTNIRPKGRDVDGQQALLDQVHTCVVETKPPVYWNGRQEGQPRLLIKFDLKGRAEPEWFIVDRLLLLTAKFFGYGYRAPAQAALPSETILWQMGPMPYLPEIERNSEESNDQGRNMNRRAGSHDRRTAGRTTGGR